jgi:arylsulfatase A-like enzyme
MSDTPPAWTGMPVSKHPREVHEPYVFDADASLTHSAFVADQTCRFLKEHPPSQPFFCISGFYAPHAPLNPPAGCLEDIDIDSLPLPKRNEGENFQDVTDEEWRNIKAHYYALIRHVDDQIGVILDCLEKTGQADNTLIVFTADHGEYLGDHGKVQKGGPEDASARVPLIVSSLNGSISSKVISDVIEHVDLLPTFLDYAEIPQPPWSQGESLRPIIEGQRNTRERSAAALIQMRNDCPDDYKAVRTSDLLYVRRFNREELLFDLRTDPDQLTNLANNPSQAELLHRGRYLLLETCMQNEPDNLQKNGLY